MFFRVENAGSLLPLKLETYLLSNADRFAEVV
jgi:hypothetical protein